MLCKQKYAILWIFIHILTYIKCSHQFQESAVKPPTTQPSNKDDAGGVEDIVQDTMILLDALDQKLDAVKNKTPSAMMRDNLRSLSGNDDETNSPKADEALLDEALINIANGFTSGRKNDDQTASISIDQLLATASELHSSTVPEKQVRNISHISETLMKGPLKTNGSVDDQSPNRQASNNNRGAMKRARQLQMGAIGGADQEDQVANDSTERHIRFTLDLMQSIFASQSYTAKTNQIESFLISPLSIQMVLMMMHLGARGQTKREINNCLHLSSSSSSSDFDKITASTQQNVGNDAAKLKRRHHHHVAAASSSSSSETVKQYAKLHNHAATTTNSRNQQQQPAAATANPHELFGAAMRNLLKDPIVVKALTSANQIFLQKNLPLSAQYEWAIRHYYGADVKLVDFQHQAATSLLPSSVSEKGKLSKEMLGGQANSTLASSESTANVTGANSMDGNNIQQTINDWIERQTKGRISNFLSTPVPTSTLLMAINVLYFKGDWQYKFDPTDTESDAWFTQANGNTVKMPMMVNRLPLAFAHDPVMKTSVIELPYKAQRLGLFLLLPDEISGIFHTMQMLNSTSFANLISSMRKPSPTADQGANGINVRIPKFSIESSPRLSQILSQQLGLKTLFMPDSADLSGMFAWQSTHKRSPGDNTISSPLQHRHTTDTATDQQVPVQVGLDELLHKAVLQVDEQGSVAAASSATIVERVGLFNSNYFEADHPFLLFLMDKQTGLVLFSGAFAGNAHESSSDKNVQIHKNKNSDTNGRQN